MQYPLDIHDDLLIGHFGQHQLLIDTGAPASFADSDFEIMGMGYEVSRDFMGHDATYFSKKLNRKIDGFLGADILGEFDYCIDWRQQTIELSRSSLDPVGYEISMDQAMGLPYVINLMHLGNIHRCYLDTGATVTYLDLDETPDCEIIGHFEDFNPMFGDFSTDLYRCTAQVDDLKFSIKAGKLPHIANMMLPLMGVNGILGADLFKAYRVTFVPRDSKIYLEPYNRAHDSWARHYDVVNQTSFGIMLDELTESTLDYIDTLLGGQGSVLDAGSGTGRISIPLCKQGYDVVAIDASSEMVDQQRDKSINQQCGFPLIHSSIENYKPVQSFDLVTCLHTVTAYLYTSEMLEKAARMFSEAIKQNGKVLIDVPFKGLFRNFVYESPGFRRVVEFEKLDGKQYRYREETYRQAEKGFKYSDEFLLCAWSIDDVVKAFEKSGLKLDKDLTEQFEGSGHYYLLFSKQGIEV